MPVCTTNDQPAAPILTKREAAAAVIDPEAWADEIEARKGNKNPNFTTRITISLRKADAIAAIYDIEL